MVGFYDWKLATFNTRGKCHHSTSKGLDKVGLEVDEHMEDPNLKKCTRAHLGRNVKRWSHQE
jgi:hypothetical protein